MQSITSKLPVMTQASAFSRHDSALSRAAQIHHVRRWCPVAETWRFVSDREPAHRAAVDAAREACQQKNKRDLLDGERAEITVGGTDYRVEVS